MEIALLQGLSLNDPASLSAAGHGLHSDGLVLKLSSQKMSLRSSKPVCFAIVSKSSGSSMKEEKRGLYRPFELSPELKAFVGEEKMSRAEVIQQLWAYIRENNLQDPDNRRKIRCNEALRSLFDTDMIDMLQMSKLISKHIFTSVGPDGSPRPKRPKTSRAPKKSPIFTPQPISKELQTFLGLSETELVRSRAIKLIWGYVKENNLQDPADKRNIICDSKLRELLQCEGFQGLAMTKFLVPHFLKDDTVEN